MKGVALVTGAGGAIGSMLVGYLIEQGYSVRALVRNESALKLLPKAAEVLRGEITDAAVLREAAERVDLIFHLAAKLHVNNPDPRLRDEYEQVNVEGTRLLSEAAARAGARRLVFFSTINVYGPSQPDQLMTEDSTLHPDSLYAETKARAEKVALTSAPAVVLRLAAVYGARMKGNFPRLLNALRKRRLALVGDGRNRRTLVFDEDVCRAGLLAAEHPAAEGKIFNVTDGAVHTLREIVNAMSDALGRPRPKVRLPETPVRLAAGLLEDGLRLVGRQSPVGRQTVDKLVEDVAVSGDLIQRELGFQPLFDLQAGWRKTIKEMLNNNGEGLIRA